MCPVYVFEVARVRNIEGGSIVFFVCGLDLHGTGTSIKLVASS